MHAEWSGVRCVAGQAVWHAVAQWMGVEQPDLAAVLPNLRHFVECEAGTPGCRVFAPEDLFRSG